MTEKRFVDYFDKDHNYIIQDLQNEDEYQVGFVNCDEDVFLKLVNELADENRQLKQHNTELINKIDFLERIIDGDVWMTENKRFICCFSGGKDSTAMLIHILENELPLDEIIYCDVGAWTWESENTHT